jgi:hypothetical protein
MLPTTVFHRKPFINYRLTSEHKDEYHIAGVMTNTNNPCANRGSHCDLDKGVIKTNALWDRLCVINSPNWHTLTKIKCQEMGMSKLSNKTLDD